MIDKDTQFNIKTQSEMGNIIKHENIPFTDSVVFYGRVCISPYFKFYNSELATKEQQDFFDDIEIVVNNYIKQSSKKLYFKDKKLELK